MTPEELTALDCPKCWEKKLMREVNQKEWDELHEAERLTELDLAVAKARGMREVTTAEGFCCDMEKGEPFQPTRSWADAGPLLEELKLDLMWRGDGTVDAFQNKGASPRGNGSTPLIAICRAYVAAKEEG